jgi:NDP-sugar pyrophosphorylase family protein
MNDRHCVVLAGGLGTRLLPITGGLLPKALAPVLETPFINYKLESLVQMGCTSVSLMIGELGFMIEDHIWSNPLLKLDIQCLHDGETLLGTGGAIAKWTQRLPDKFWITYADSLVVADLDKAEEKLGKSRFSGIMTVFHNSDWLQVSNTNVIEDAIDAYDKSANLGTYEWIDYGLLYLRREHFETVIPDQYVDLSAVFSPLIANRNLMAWEATERFWEIGSPAALRETEAELVRRSKN